MWLPHTWHHRRIPGDELSGADCWGCTGGIDRHSGTVCLPFLKTAWGEFVVTHILDAGCSQRCGSLKVWAHYGTTSHSGSKLCDASDPFDL